MLVRSGTHCKVRNGFEIATLQMLQINFRAVALRQDCRSGRLIFAVESSRTEGRMMSLQRRLALAAVPNEDRERR